MSSISADSFRYIDQIIFPGASAPRNLETELLIRKGFVRVGELESYFTDWFLNERLPTIIEPACLINCFELMSAKNVLTARVIEVLGGASVVETSFAEVFFLLSLQSAGEDGILQVNCRANSFFILDATRTIRNVNAIWNAGRWTLSAADPKVSGLIGGSRIFVRAH